MSNVLIGIIGVILFIGLALAGASFLGEKFMSSENSTTATKTISDMQQISAAINMRRLKTGNDLIASNYATNLQSLTPRFLKSMPTVPMSNATYQTVDRNGGRNNLPVHHIKANLGDNTDGEVTSVCREIEAQRGSQDVDAAMATIPASQYADRINASVYGCLRHQNGKTYAFLKI